MFYYVSGFLVIFYCYFDYYLRYAPLGEYQYLVVEVGKDSKFASPGLGTIISALVSANTLVKRFGKLYCYIAMN